jgi:hypothetical protein
MKQPCKCGRAAFRYVTQHPTCRKAGAKDNGAPGVRNSTIGYYAAYVFDLDGNNIEVVLIDSQ